MILDFNFPFKGLDGEDLPNTNAGKLIANTLASYTKGDALKFWSWAMKLQEGLSLDLDPSDIATLKSFLQTHESLTVLSRAQCLAVFN